MIVLHLRDLPPGVSPMQAAALVLGPERAARELIVTIRTEDMPQSDPPFKQAATDHQSAGRVNSAPVTKPEHLGLAFAELERIADEVGLDLSLTPAGYRLAGPQGSITRGSLGELIGFIRDPRRIPFGEYDRATE